MELLEIWDLKYNKHISVIITVIFLFNISRNWTKVVLTFSLRRPVEAAFTLVVQMTLMLLLYGDSLLQFFALVSYGTKLITKYLEER